MSADFLNHVQDLLEKSEGLVAHLELANDQKEYKDDFIDRIQVLLDERQVIMDRLEAEAQKLNSDIKTLVDAHVPTEISSQLLELEKKISSDLKVIFGNIQHSRKLFQNKQRTNKQYRNPYASVAARDGMFVDKRK